MATIRSVRKMTWMAALLCLWLFLAAGVYGKDNEVEQRKAKVKSMTIESEPERGDTSLHAKEKQIAQKLTESIALLKRLIKKSPGSQKADLYFRLAESYWQKSRYTTFLLSYDYDKKMKRYDDMVKRGVKNVPLPSLDMSEAIQYRKTAIKVYQVLVKHFPDYTKLDRAYFFLGYNLNDKDIGATDKAEMVFKRFLQKFPNSSYRPDAILALGEIYFNKNRMEDAIARYRALIELGPRTLYYNYGLYKLGWCYYNLQRHNDAVEAFKKVVEFEDSDKRKTRKINLKEEALDDLVLAFSQVGDIEAAQIYFKEVGESKYFLRLLERLGNIYFQQGKFTSAASAFKRLLREDPYGPQGPEFQNKVVDSYRRLQQKERTNEEMAWLVSRYNPRSAWATKNQRNTEVIVQAKKTVENTLRLLATTYHAEAKKTLRDQTYDLAATNYRLYLTYFSDVEAIYEMRYYFAQLLFERKDFKASAEQYRLVAAANPKGKYLKDAALNTIVSYQEEVKREQPVFPNKTKDVSVKPISQAEQALVEACDAYAKWLPKDERTADTLLSAAKIYYNYNHFEEAVVRLGSIVELYPDHYVAVEASRLILSSFNWQKKYVDLNTWARKLFRNPTLKNQKLKDQGEIGREEKEVKGAVAKTFGEELYGLIKKSAFKNALDLESQNKYDLAAKEFIKFEKEFPRSEDADKALYNAAVNFQRTQNLQGMIDVQKKLVAQYPTSPLTPKVIYMIGVKYEQNVDFMSAAGYFELLAKQYPDYENSADALLASALYREAEKKYPDAYRSLAILVEKFPKRKDLKEVQFHMGELLEKQKKYFEAVEAYRRVLEAYPDDKEVVLKAHRAIGSNYMLYGNPEKAKYAFKAVEEAYEKLPAAAQRKDDNRYQVGEAKFLLADAIYQDYRHGRPAGDEKTYANGLDKRFRLLNVLEKTYLGVVEVKSTAWAIRSLCRLGEVFREHADDYANAPISARFNENQLKMYKEALQKQSQAFIKNADQFYQACLDKAKELDFFADETKNAENYFDQRDKSRLVMNFVYPLKFDDLIEDDFTYGRIELW